MSLVKPNKLNWPSLEMLKFACIFEEFESVFNLQFSGVSSLPTLAQIVSVYITNVNSSSFANKFVQFIYCNIRASQKHHHLCIRFDIWDFLIEKCGKCCSTRWFNYQTTIIQHSHCSG